MNQRFTGEIMTEETGVTKGGILALVRALLRSAKEDDRETARGRANIISANIKILEGRPDDAGLRQVILSQIDDLSALLRQPGRE